jgi:hypothetical protein
VFEGLLMECLADLGCRLVLRSHAPGAVADAIDAELSIHAHATRRDVEGDLYYKQMHLRNLFTIDTEGWGADHSIMRSGPDFEWVDHDAAAAFCDALSRTFLTTGISKDRQPPLGGGGGLPDDFIFVPTQLRTDYVNIHHSPIAVPDFIRTVAAWGDARRQNLVVKIHPSGRNDQEVIDAVAHCRREFAYVHFADANVHELITRSAGVITINSGVGFESLIHGRPVATFGDCDYRWVTHNTTEATLDAARDHIYGFSPEQLRRQQRFIHHYCNHHAYSIEPEAWWGAKARLRGYLEGVMVRLEGMRDECFP